MTENVSVTDLEPVPKVSGNAAHKNSSDVVDLTNKGEKSTEEYNDQASTEKVNEDITCKYPGITISRLPPKIRNEKKELGEGRTDNNRNVVKGRVEEMSMLERAVRFIPAPDLVDQIMELGICRNAAINALFFTGNSSDTFAINWLMDGPGRNEDITLKDRVLGIMERQRKDKLALVERQNYIVDTAIKNYRRTRLQGKQPPSDMVHHNHQAGQMVHHNHQMGEMVHHNHQTGEIVHHNHQMGQMVHHNHQTGQMVRRYRLDGEVANHDIHEHGVRCLDQAGDVSALKSRHDPSISNTTIQNKGQPIEIQEDSSINPPSKEVEDNMEKENHHKTLSDAKKVSFDTSHLQHRKEDYVTNVRLDQYVHEIDDSDEMDEEMMDEEDMGSEYKMVLVVNSELNMNEGILAQQTAKATLGLANIIKLISINSLLGPEEFSLWEDYEERMETLKADTDEHLNDLELMAEDLNLPNYAALLFKEGGKPKRAVLAIFGSDDVVDKVTGRLTAMDSQD